MKLKKLFNPKTRNNKPRKYREIAPASFMRLSLDFEVQYSAFWDRLLRILA
jgi:hypothetical protein